MPFKDPAMGGCGTRQIARPKEETFCFTDIMMVRNGIIGPCFLSQYRNVQRKNEKHVRTSTVPTYLKFTSHSFDFEV